MSECCPTGSMSDAITITATPIFMKQYGEQRTGTNLLRALLLKHFVGVEVLMHVLGDKHAPPTDLAALFHHADAMASDDQLIRRATEETGAQTTNLSHSAQDAYVRSIARPLAAAIRTHLLHYVVSLKDPYAWAVGYMHLRGWWPKAGAPRWPDRVVAPLLAEACESFNQKYVAWLTLSHRWPERTSFVRHEDLLASEARVLLRLQQRHGLQRHAASPAPLRGIILPTHWDHEPPQEHFERFDAEFYRRRDYLTLLTPRLHQVVSEKIDWSLMQRFGYQRVTNSR